MGLYANLISLTKSSKHIVSSHNKSYVCVLSTNQEIKLCVFLWVVMYSVDGRRDRSWINGWGKACFCLDVSGAADCIVLLQIHSRASFTILVSLLKDNLLSHPEPVMFIQCNQLLCCGSSQKCCAASEEEKLRKGRVPLLWCSDHCVTVTLFDLKTSFSTLCFSVMDTDS